LGAVRRSVIVVDGHAALRDALGLLLRSWDWDPQALTGDPGRAEELIRSMAPDVVVFELDVAGRGDGAALARRLIDGRRDAPILLFTGARDEHVLRDAMGIGARGLLTKAASPHELRDALGAVAAGRSYLDHRLSRLAIALSARTGQLSDREREVLTLLADGSTGGEVAERLVLSPETVRTHVRNAMEKLGARTRAHAVVLAIARGEIPAPNAGVR
jgi:DNA-binding NarL/FixJ family response regulator